MKKILSIFSVILALMMLVSSVVPAFAENEAAADEEADYVRLTSKTDFDPDGVFSFSSDGNNAEIDPDVCRYAAIRYRTITELTKDGLDIGAQFYVMNPAEPYIPVIYNHTKKWETLVVDMTSVSVTKAGMDSIWNSDSYQFTSCIRFDPMEPNRENPDFVVGKHNGYVCNDAQIDIAWIAFFENEADAKAYTGKETTPYCYIDAASLENPVTTNNLKVTRFTNGEKEEKEELDPIVINRRSDAATAVQINGRELAIRTATVPEGYALKDLILSNCPTWTNTAGDSDVLAEVYIWQGNYDDTLDYDPITSYEVLDHKDNAACKFTFEEPLRYGHEYLIIISPSNTGAFGFWTGEALPEDCGWEVFLDEVEEETNIPPIEYTLKEAGEIPDYVLPTKAPTKEPTQVPEPTEAPTPTEVPAVTEEPAPTKAASDDKKDADKKDGPNVVLIVVIAAVVVAAAVAVIIIAKKKKK